MLLVLTMNLGKHYFRYSVHNVISVQNYIYPTGPTEPENIC